MDRWLREALGRRPGWMNALLAFCVFMTFVFMPWDLFVKPVAEDQEAWLGFLLHGWLAKLTEPIHWAIYAAGMYGLWRMRRWMWPWAALYVAQVAIGMLIWGVVYVGGLKGWLSGLVGFLPIGALAIALWQARDRFGRKRGELRARYGDWALITGASAGIGAEFARALARDGLSCALVARREDRLRALAAELERDHGVATRIFAIDLALPSACDQLAAGVADLPIGVLVNNAGAGYAGRFDRQDPARLESIIRLNCIAPVTLTSRLLVAMRERGRGAVVIVGSVAGRPAAAAPCRLQRDQGLRSARRRGALGGAARQRYRRPRSRARRDRDRVSGGGRRERTPGRAARRGGRGRARRARPAAFGGLGVVQLAARQLDSHRTALDRRARRQGRRGEVHASRDALGCQRGTGGESEGAMRAVMTTCGGFLLGVLWMDLLFDVQALGHGGEAGIASIAAYYARATTGATPMNRLIAVAMLLTLAASVHQLVRGPGHRRWGALALGLVLVPIGLAIARVLPNAIRLGTQLDPPPVQAELARSICLQHLLCFALMLAFVLVVGFAGRQPPAR